MQRRYSIGSVRRDAPLAGLNSFLEHAKSRSVEGPARYRLGVSPLLNQNLNSDLLMMDSSEDWYRCDGAELLWTRKIGCVLVLRKMRADVIIIVCVPFQNQTHL